jgi:hypothetical protein
MGTRSWPCLLSTRSGQIGDRESPEVYGEAFRFQTGAGVGTLIRLAQLLVVSLTLSELRGSRRKGENGDRPGKGLVEGGQKRRIRGGEGEMVDEIG